MKWKIYLSLANHDTINYHKSLPDSMQIFVIVNKKNCYFVTRDIFPLLTLSSVESKFVILIY